MRFEVVERNVEIRCWNISLFSSLFWRILCDRIWGVVLPNVLCYFVSFLSIEQSYCTDFAQPAIRSNEGVWSLPAFVCVCVCVCVLASPKCSRRCFGFASTHVEKAVSSLRRLSLKLECRKVSSPHFVVVYDVARLNHYTETPLRSLAQRSHWMRKL